MKTLVFMIMAIPPWGLLVNASFILGVVGVFVQLSGLIFMIWIGSNGRWGE